MNSLTGEKTVNDLKHPRLLSNAVPSWLPNCPEHLSGSKVGSRMSREENLSQRENSELLEAINRSRMEDEKLQENLCHTLNGLA